MPFLTVVAGPNGAGKSSLIRISNLDGLSNLLDTDAIAKRLNPSDPLRAGAEAGREVIQRTQGFLKAGQSFVLETTLSEKLVLRVMRQAVSQGFSVRLLYVYVADATLAIERVRERVSKGGHSVPDEDVRRRYERSMVHLVEALRVADRTIIYDNSKSDPQAVLELRNGIIEWVIQNPPIFIQQIMSEMPPPAAKITPVSAPTQTPSQTQATHLKSLIREIQNWPKSGFNFYDITTLLKDKAGFGETIDALQAQYRGQPIDIVVGIEARGYFFAPAMAHAFGAGFVPVRKPKKLPHKVYSVEYALEYGTDTLEMHADAIQPGQNVLIVDDVLATGGTAAAVAQLVQMAQGKVTGLAFVIEIEFLKGRAKLPGFDVYSLLQY